jgi:hypothetical protein
MSSGTTKGVDVDAVGTINGVSTYDFDLDGIQADDKPWRKPVQICFCAVFPLNSFKIFLCGVFLPNFWSSFFFRQIRSFSYTCSYNFYLKFFLHRLFFSFFSENYVKHNNSNPFNFFFRHWFYAILVIMGVIYWSRNLTVAWVYYHLLLIQDMYCQVMQGQKNSCHTF